MLCHVVWYHLHLLQEGIFACPWLMLLPLWFVRLMLLPHVQCSWLMLLPLWFVRLMLLPYVQCSWLMLLPVHVWLMLLPWWLMLNPPMGVLADIIAKVAWWNSHWVNFLILILMFCVSPHPIYEADGTCLCSCLGMGHWPLWIEPL